MTISRRHGRARGSTVVEVLVALAVFTLGAAGAYHYYLQAARGGAWQEEQAQARYLAHQQLEELLACGHGKLAAWIPPEGNVQIQDQFYGRSRVTRQADSSLAITVKVWRSHPNNNDEPSDSQIVTGVKLP